MKTGKQEQICVKLDRSVLAALELEHGISAMPRNRIINHAVRAYTLAIDMARGYRAGVMSRDEYANWFLMMFTRWLLDPSGSSSLVVKKEGGE